MYCFVKLIYNENEKYRLSVYKQDIATMKQEIKIIWTKPDLCKWTCVEYESSGRLGVGVGKTNFDTEDYHVSISTTCQWS